MVNPYLAFALVILVVAIMGIVPIFGVDVCSLQNVYGLTLLISALGFGAVLYGKMKSRGMFE